MSDASNALQVFERLHEVSIRMVEAALANDWGRLVALEAEQAGLRTRARQAEPSELDAASAGRKAQLIQATLANDAEVRRHVEPWMSSARKLLASGNTSRAMRAAYGAHGPR